MRKAISTARRSSVFVKAALAASLLAGGALLFPACENSDPTAPEGSTITVSADPQTVGPNIDSTITATLRSGSGTRLPDQEVIFTTTAGTLDPPAQTPILTDDRGVADCTLTTTTSATVTAQSGSISENTTVNYQKCTLSLVLLNINPQTITSCSEVVTLTAEARDTDNVLCEGVLIEFSADPPASGLTQLPGDIDRTSGLTDSNGEFGAVFTPSSVSCQPDCGLAVCETDFIARSGSITSSVVTLREDYTQ
jgi:hypothetical protein